MVCTISYLRIGVVFARAGAIKLFAGMLAVVVVVVAVDTTDFADVVVIGVADVVIGDIFPPDKFKAVVFSELVNVVPNFLFKKNISKSSNYIF